VCALLRFMLLLTLIAAAALVLPLAAAGQTGLATVTGSLSDESGASLPGVTVVVTNQATNITYTGVTNQAGNYIIRESLTVLVIVPNDWL
jgi:phosphatidate phosphatase APP1